jgi:hypothetical protein
VQPQNAALGGVLNGECRNTALKPVKKTRGGFTRPLLQELISEDELINQNEQ